MPHRCVVTAGESRDGKKSRAGNCNGAPAMDTKFGVEGRDVNLDRALGEIKFLRYLPVGPPLHDQVKNLQLTIGQRMIFVQRYPPATREPVRTAADIGTGRTIS
jgi:hypothetical protein